MECIVIPSQKYAIITHEGPNTEIRKAAGTTGQLCEIETN
jgi:predicted transcriptional regulator YdeE